MCMREDLPVCSTELWKDAGSPQRRKASPKLIEKISLIFRVRDRVCILDGRIKCILDEKKSTHLRALQQKIPAQHWLPEDISLCRRTAQGLHLGWPFVQQEFGHLPRS